MSSFEKKFDHLKIPLVDIQTATNNFTHENLIKKPGNVYKGQLVSGKLIDIVAQRFDPKVYMYGTKEFYTEIMMLASLKHRNVVSIVGFCDEDGEKIIINKFEAKGSLGQYLSDPATLTWTQRLQICLEIACALSYIHYDKQRNFSVIHRDIRSSNILLGDKWEPKLSGFGLSTMQPATRRHGLVFDEFVCTYEYVDPAYIASATVNHKSDVYSFGVVLFEVLTGRKTFIRDHKNTVSLANLAKSHYENETLDDIIHPGLLNQMDSHALKKFSDAAYCCLNEQRTQRPNVDQLIFALDQALKLQLEHENSEHSTPAVEGTSTSYWKGKRLEYLKIGLDSIKAATENFAEKYFIGSGGYGWVYKAELEHFDSGAMKGNDESEPPRRHSTVAIKYILKRDDTQGEQGFLRKLKR